LSIRKEGKAGIQGFPKGDEINDLIEGGERAISRCGAFEQGGHTEKRKENAKGGGQQNRKRFSQTKASMIKARRGGGVCWGKANRLGKKRPSRWFETIERRACIQGGEKKISGGKRNRKREKNRFQAV